MSILAFVVVGAFVASNVASWIIGNVQGESRGFAMGKQSAELQANPPERSVVKVVHYQVKKRRSKPAPVVQDGIEYPQVRN